jgi:putative flippase GtrA
VRLPGRFSWYVVGQVLAYAFEVTSFSLVFFLTAAPILANVIGKVLAACFAFVFHARISFAHEKGKNLHSSAGSYVLVIALNAILTSSLFWILLRTTPIEPLYLKVFCDAVFVFVSFVLIGKFVFPVKREARS